MYDALCHWTQYVPEHVILQSGRRISLSPMAVLRLVVMVCLRWHCSRVVRAAQCLVCIGVSVAAGRMLAWSAPVLEVRNVLTQCCEARCRWWQ